MIRLRSGRVKRIVTEYSDLQEIEVEVEGETASALVYPGMTGPVRPGVAVLLNTTAVHKRLGTGGQHFVIAVDGLSMRDISPTGHIMKMRYSPQQVRVQSVEEPDSPFHETMRKATSLDAMPVVVGTLHSVLAPVALATRKAAGRECRIAYVMTDGGALPAAMSRSVRALRRDGIIVGTVTCGHAFGGDLEAITVHSGLLAARHVLKADLAIVAMGPGVVGTGTPFGTTALEQGVIVDAAADLGGVPVAVLRVGFTDARSRHQGVSHHSLTALGRLSHVVARIPLPSGWSSQERDLVLAELRQAGITAKHRLVWVDTDTVMPYLKQHGRLLQSMGRGPDEIPHFFSTAAACGVAAADLVWERK